MPEIKIKGKERKIIGLFSNKNSLLLFVKFGKIYLRVVKYKRIITPRLTTNILDIMITLITIPSAKRH